LAMHNTESQFFVAGKELGSGAPTKVAVDAGGIDIEGAGGVL
jgi:hypothetical protein